MMENHLLLSRECREIWNKQNLWQISLAGNRIIGDTPIQAFWFWDSLPLNCRVQRTNWSQCKWTSSCWAEGLPSVKVTGEQAVLHPLTGSFQYSWSFIKTWLLDSPLNQLWRLHCSLILFNDLNKNFIMCSLMRDMIFPFKKISFNNRQ